MKRALQDLAFSEYLFMKGFVCMNYILLDDQALNIKQKSI